MSQPPSPLSPAAAGDGPLSAQEVSDMLQARWQVSYDLQLVQRRGRVYLQVMWAYLEQQSFPLSEEGYRAKLEELVGLLTTDKPRLGKALGLVLEMPAGRASEFLL
ncbi:MAG: DUF3067 family protein [Cyanobium sp. LacPavin_0818_WC50_MAG_67_9]|nr:DUF3067 family protein [Cyanobium sp. LacPavin_0818_WC50_MAG_67_9]